MDAVIITIIGGLFTVFSTVLGIVISSNKKFKDDTNKALSDLKLDVKILENTALKEEDAKILIEDSIKPITEGIKDISKMIGSINDQLHKIEIDKAKRDAKEELLGNNQER